MGDSKPTLYLAGPIFGCDDATATTWRNLVIAALGDRYEYRNPMARDYRGSEGENVNAIVLGDLADINASDIVLARCDRPSWGTAMEIHHAFTIAQKRVIVVCGADRVSPWLRYHSHRIERTLVDAIGYLRGVTLR